MLASSAILASLLSPFAYLISGSVAGLITLRKGPAYGLQAMLVSGAILTVFALLSGLSWLISVGFLVAVWLPIWCVASVLRLSESQGAALFIAGFITCLLVIAFYLRLDDVSLWWYQWFLNILERTAPAETLTIYQQALKPFSVLLNAIMNVGFMLNVFSAVLLARWWQSGLFNPGAFKKEFHALCLPTLVLPVSAIALLLVTITEASLQYAIRDMLFVLMFMYLIQGISAVHRNVARYELSKVWLISMYLFLLLLPQLGLLIALLGMVDIYLQWRVKKVSD